VRAAAKVLSRANLVLYTYPLEEAARRAVRPTYDELLVLIAQKRRENLHPGPIVQDPRDS
jgi:hypothetical protein